MKLVILAIIITAISVVLLGIKVLFIKDGKFPSSHIHDNPHLRKRGIDCASSADKRH
ncbi:MAG: hypothetical protein K2M65_00245 [Muribaculaceae bacterium]|nr:hypothetical protein [Muribaculaceae bacterium]